MHQIRASALTPAKIILGGFLALILAGTGLLMLPIATRSGVLTPFSDALFTATSATCVTGLVLHDTYTYWSIFGQAVILMLIQIGGMGVVTLSVAIAVFTGRKIGLKQRFVMQESISAPQMGGIVRLTTFILKAAFLFEGVGAALLAIRFIPRFGLGQGLWFAVFHAVSAFCNAGFDLMGVDKPFSSLTGFMGDPLVNLVIMLLIVCGGIGFFVWDDIRRNRHHVQRYRLQTKLVLVTTALLIALPAVFFYLGEFSKPVWAWLDPGQRVWASLFQSVTPRTAGFNTVDLTMMTDISVLVMIMLMLVGGSPGSTAGGVKTTTLSLLLLSVLSVFRRRENIQCFQRRIPPETLKNAVAIFTLYLFLFSMAAGLISMIDDVPLVCALFESASAIGTVGLSLGITGELSHASQMILVGLMYFGRVGGLTMIYAIISARPHPPVQLPLERITVG